MKEDKLTVVILPDGRIRMEADKISQANHGSAESFVRDVARLAGGQTSRKSKHKHGRTSHTHSHGEDEHEHH